MDRLTVTSRAFASVSYSASTQVLRVEYRPRKDGYVVVEEWSPVVQSVVDAMLVEGASAGSILHHRVKSHPGASCQRTEYAPEELGAV